MKSKRLRWKKEPKAGSGPRGSVYHDGETEYASVSAICKGHWVIGWYWVVFDNPGIPYVNNCKNPCETVGEARREAAAHVNAALEDKAA